MDAATAQLDAPQDAEGEDRTREEDADRPRAEAEAMLRRLYARHANRLTRRAALVSGDEAAAQDVVQEAFVLAFHRLDEIAQLPDAGAWLWGVVRHKLQNLRRKQRRRRDLWRRFGRRQPHADETAAQSVAEAELEQRLEAALAALTDDEREAFVVRHVEQLSLKEASVELDLSISTLSARARRAADKVRSHFEEASR